VDGIVSVVESERISEHDSAVEAINEALSLTLGQAQKTNTLYIIGQRFHLKLEQVPEEPARFVEAVNHVFGPTVGSTLIRLILRELKRRRNRVGEQSSLLTNFETACRSSTGVCEPPR
jgi:hypothetical protein